MSIYEPLNLRQWIEDHRDLLKPPVGNKQIWRDERDTIIMVVGGPNARKDYHVNATEEFFYQVTGECTVRIQHPETGKPHDIVIGEGDIYLLPANIPHSPQRAAGTVGLVIEQKRPAGVKDKLRWYSEDTNELLWEAEFTLENIETDLQTVFAEFWGNESLRTCKSTGSVMQPPAVV